MSDSNNQKTTFASRLLDKELTNRKKTTTNFFKLNPADAAKYANEIAETKEKVTATK